MNYELAKSLKDAGWPIEASSWTFHDENPKESVPCPTLSELIEACGIRFSALHHNLDGSWQALAWIEPEEDGQTQLEGLGVTSEVAVANLLLALIKK